LNERSVESVRGAGFRVDLVGQHVRGYVVTIDASRD
jgi:hypothetical protein